MEQEYTRNNCIRHLGQHYFLSNLDELNILADAMENKLCLRYKTHIINFHRHHKVLNAVCKSTMNLAFLILQPKITRIKKIKQVTKNEVKWKESRQRETKNGLLCSTDFQRIKSKYISQLRKNIRQK